MSPKHVFDYLIKDAWISKKIDENYTCHVADHSYRPENIISCVIQFPSPVEVQNINPLIVTT
jgi:hypothetical protein